MVEELADAVAEALGEAALRQEPLLLLFKLLLFKLLLFKLLLLLLWHKEESNGDRGGTGENSQEGGVGISG